MTTDRRKVYWLRELLKKNYAALLSYFVLELAAIALSLLFVYFSKQAIDLAVDSTDNALNLILTGVVCTMLGGVLIKGFSGWLNERMRIKMLYRLQLMVADAQLDADWSTFKVRHSGDVQLRVQSDSEDVVNMLAYSALSTVLTAVRLIASFVFLWLMEPTLALLILAVTPFLLLAKIYFRRLKRLTAEAKQQESHFASILSENLRLRMVIQAMGIGQQRRQQLEGSQNRLLILKNRQLLFSTLTQNLMKLLLNMGYLLTFIWGVYRLHVGAISFGTMAAFLQLVGRIQTPAVSLMGFFPQFVRFRVAVDRIHELLNQPNETTVAKKLLANLQQIRIEQLSFRYEQQWVIRELSVAVLKGIPLAITGATGKGKTTLLRLFLGMLKPTEGRIVVQDGESFQQLEPAHRTNFTYVPQGNSLFSGTIRDNVTAYAKLADEQMIRQVLWLACAEFVYKLPQGLDTVIGEAGIGLSEGQAQRVAIARALMQDRPICLFDEITSALDRATTEALVERLLTWGKNKLCIFVTHDRYVMEQCSQRLNMK